MPLEGSFSLSYDSKTDSCGAETKDGEPPDWTPPCAVILQDGVKAV